MEIMQLMTAWNSKVRQAWKACANKSISKAGSRFIRIIKKIKEKIEIT